jgi:hypothetical protein
MRMKAFYHVSGHFFRKGNGMAIITRISLLLVVSLVVSSFLTQPRTLYSPKAYRVVYSVTVTNISCQMDSLEIWIPRPIEWDAQRDVCVEEVVPAPSNVYQDSTHGNGICYWLFDDAPGPGNTITVSQIFTYTGYDVLFDVDPGLVGSYDQTSDVYQIYTVSEDKIEAGHPDIQSTAATIVGSETNPYEEARLIYSWVLDHMVYQSYDGFNGALLSLQNGWGECGDYSTLFCALLRAVGIPARPVVGWLAKTGRSHHVWAEFFLSNYGWTPVDPSWDDGNNPWQYFGKVPCSNRLISSKGSNIELAAGWVSSIFQTFSWRWWGQSGESNTDCQILVEQVPLGSASVFRVDAGGTAYTDGSFYGQNFLAGAADVAEWVLVSEEVERGDVLELDPENPGHYRKSRGPCSTLVAGVVSTDPGFVLGSSSPTLDSGPWTDDSRFPTDNSRLATEDSALLALIGIVPVKVTDEGGPIKPGDLLVASSTPGYAMRWDPDLEACGSLLGKALERLKDAEGVILMLLVR